MSEWLFDEQAQLLGRLLTAMMGMNMLSLIMTTIIALLYPQQWQAWLLDSLLAITFLLTLLARRKQRQRQLRFSANLIIGSTLVLALITSLLFYELDNTLLVLGLLITTLGGVLINPRAGYRYAAVVGGLVVLAELVNTTGINPFRLTTPPGVEFAVNLLLFGIIVTLGTYLIGLSTNRAHRAIQQFLAQSTVLQKTNAMLAVEMRQREAAIAEVIKLAVENERATILSNFVRDASHEFRTPLSVINAEIYMLQRTSLAEEERQRLRHIQQQATYINTLVDSLLEMTWLDSSDMPLNKVSLPVSRLLVPLVDRLRDDLAHNHRTITLDMTDAPCALWADPDRLATAIWNILQNAVEHTPEDGTIAVRAACENKRLTITIQDQGPGIPLKVQERIFERFYRGDEARTTRGVGLGLSITRKIVELHQGRIRVESHPGQGTAFHIDLPLQPPARKN